MNKAEEAGHPRIFYGWIVVAACFALTATIGETYWCFGVFFKPLEDEFGWSRAVLSSGYTAYIIGYAISSIVGGRLIDRYSPRVVLPATASLAGIGISLCSQVQNIDQLRIFLFMAGLGSGAAFIIPASSVQRWFRNRQRAGLALSITMSGVGVGALVFAPLINLFILNYNWRTAFLLVGIIFFITVAVASIVIKESPADAGVFSAKANGLPKTANAGEWTTRKAMLTPAFGCLLFVNSVVLIAFHSVSVHIVPLAIDAGISATVSAAALGLMGGFSTPGRLGSGLMSQRLRWQKLLSLSCFGMALSVIWLIFLRESWMLYVFVLIYGTFLGIRSTAYVGIVSELFGMRSLGELIGIVAAVGNLVGAAAPYLAGLVYDTIGSYSIAFLVMIVLLLSGSLVLLVMKKPAPPG